MKSVFQHFVTYDKTLQNIHPLEDGSGQARLPVSSTPGSYPMGSPLPVWTLSRRWISDISSVLICPWLT